MNQGECVRQYDQPAVGFFCEPADAAPNFRGIINRYDKGLNSRSAGGIFGSVQIKACRDMRRCGSIENQRRARNLWRDLLELLEPLATHRLFKIAEPGCVAAGPRQRGNEAATNRIRDLHKDDRGMLVRLLQPRDGKIAFGEDHVRFQACELFGQDTESRGMTARPAGSGVLVLSCCSSRLLEPLV